MALARLYRAWPWRAHCDRRAGVHALPCRLGSALLASRNPCVPVLRWPCVDDFDG
jgi:hypothetical protein